jgi:hypothetical protein
MYAWPLPEIKKDKPAVVCTAAVVEADVVAVDTDTEDGALVTGLNDVVGSKVVTVGNWVAVLTSAAVTFGCAIKHSMLMNSVVV